MTREALGIVLEFAPKHIDIEEVKRVLLSLNGVRDVHDLHVWTITSGFVALACHMRVAAEADASALLREAGNALTQRFQIRHVTIQPEHEPLHGQAEPGVCCLDEHALEPERSEAGR